jgi:hypothetical protein
MTKMPLAKDSGSKDTHLENDVANARGNLGPVAWAGFPALLHP